MPSKQPIVTDLGDKRIILKRNNAYPWYSSEKVWVKGYGFYENKLHKEESLVALFSNLGTTNEILNVLKNLEGFYCIIIRINDDVFVAVDHLRSMPLFYAKNYGKLLITDSLDASFLKEFGLNETTCEQFDSTLFVVEEETLIEGVFQLEAGKYLLVDDIEALRQEPYWVFEYNKDIEIKESLRGVELMEIAYKEATERLIKLLDGRTALIPLSGGHDSRLIVFYLHTFGYKNIVAYSYGRTGNEESARAKEVAEFFQIPFFFVEYRRRITVPYFKETFKDFALFSSNFVSVPHIQEFFAIDWLLKHNIIDHTAVVVPGFSGDFLAGSHLVINYVDRSDYSRLELIEDLCEIFFGESRTKNKNETSLIELKRMIFKLREIEALPELITTKHAAEVAERFNLMERQGKFIQNSVRAYEFYNLEWATPLFEKKQFDVWLRIANSLRYRRSLFFEFENKIYPQGLKSIGFAGDSHKEMENNKFFKYIRMLKYLWPNTAHYLFPFFPLKRYYLELLRKNINLNQTVKKEYMRIIKMMANNH